MKNKKLIISMSIILVISILSVAMVGCKDEFSVLNIFKDSSAGKVYSTETKQLTTLSGWEYDSASGDFLILNKVNEDDILQAKMIYSLKSDKTLLTITGDFDNYVLDSSNNGIIIVSNKAANSLEVYDANGVIMSAETLDYQKDSSSYDEVKIYFGNGKTLLYNTQTGNSRIVDTAVAEVLNKDNMSRIADLYVTSDNGVTFDVYDLNYNYLRTVSFAQYDTYSHSIIGLSINSEGVIVMQFLVQLPDTATAYGFYKDGTKYNLITVAKSLATGKDVNLNLPANTLYKISPNSDYNYLVGQVYTVDKNLNQTLQSCGFYDDDFNCLFDYSKYSASGNLNTISQLSSGELYLKKDDMIFIIGSDFSVKSVYSDKNLTQVCLDNKGMPYYILGGTSSLYDVYGQFVIDLPEESSLISSYFPSTSIYYSASETSINSEGLEENKTYYYALDLETLSVKNLGETEDVSFNVLYFNYSIVTSDENGTAVSTSIYSMFDNSLILTYDNADTSSVSQYILTSSYGLPCNLFCITDTEGNTFYYLHSIKYAKA